MADKKALIEIGIAYEEGEGVGYCVACDENIYGKIFTPYVYVNHEKKNPVNGLDLCESCYYLIEDK